MKIIRSVRDLAISGREPAFPAPLHVGHPNIGSPESFFRRVSVMLEGRWLSNDGPLVRELEGRIATYLGVRNCVAMCNGTIALEIAIRALGLHGEVVVPSYTFIATAHALQWQAITPVFADIDPATHNLDPTAVRRMLTPRTSGIIGVHLWGRGAPHADLQAIADEQGIRLMYDAAHAFGCSLGGQMIGRLGACEVLSFHATKVFNTFEGGAVVTDDDVLAEKVRLMRNFGFAGYDNVIYSGTNGKMTEIAAAMGLTNLEHLDEVIARNLEHYRAYLEGVREIPGVSMIQYPLSERNNYQYVVLEVGESFPCSRDDLIGALHAENVLARRYFWPGCHRMKPYRELYPHAGLVLPNTEAVSGRVVVLPNGPTLAKGDIETIVAVLRVLAAS